MAAVVGSGEGGGLQVLGLFCALLSCSRASLRSCRRQRSRLTISFLRLRSLIRSSPSSGGSVVNSGSLRCPQHMGPCWASSACAARWAWKRRLEDAWDVRQAPLQVRPPTNFGDSPPVPAQCGLDGIDHLVVGALDLRQQQGCDDENAQGSDLASCFADVLPVGEGLGVAVGGSPVISSSGMNPFTRSFGCPRSSGV